MASDRDHVTYLRAIPAARLTGLEPVCAGARLWGAGVHSGPEALLPQVGGSHTALGLLRPASPRRIFLECPILRSARRCAQLEKNVKEFSNRAGGLKTSESHEKVGQT